MDFDDDGERSEVLEISGEEDVIGEDDEELTGAYAYSSNENPLFQYFKVEKSTLRKNQTATCLQCKKVMAQPGGTTTILKNHLIRKHQEEYKEYKKHVATMAELKKSTARKNKTVAKQKQPLIHEFVGKKKWQSNHPKAKSMNKKVAKFMVKGLHSYSIVEEPAFVEMMEEAEPHYQVPSRTTFSDNIIPGLYEEKKKELLTTLQEDKQKLSSLSITTDGWTSGANDSYLDVTCHYLDDNFQMKNFCLGHEKLEGQHTGINIQDELRRKLVEFELLPTLIPIFTVTDNARNITAAVSQMRYAEVFRRPCFAHSLNLCVKDVKNEVKGFSAICAKVRSIVGHFKRSSSAQDILHDVQKQLNLPILEVIQDVPTRWNSEYSMLERLYEMRVPIGTAINRIDVNDVESLRNSEWSVIQSYTKVLSPFAEATVEVSSESQPTSSLVIPILTSIESMLNKIVRSEETTVTPQTKTLARHFLLAIKSRFNMTNDKVFVLSMMLDPRFKGELLTTQESARWTDSIENEALALRNNSEENMESQDPGPSTSSQSSLWSSFETLKKNKSAEQPNRRSVIRLEISHYLNSPVIDRKADPLKFWRNNVSNYPTLSLLAQKYLRIPATEVASERQNSTAGNIVTERRRRLRPEHVEQQVFLHDNL